MDFVSIRIITDDVARLAGFYELATGVQATWSNENLDRKSTRLNSSHDVISRMPSSA